MDTIKDFWGRDLFVVKGVHVTIGGVVIVVVAIYLWRRLEK